MFTRCCAAGSARGLGPRGRRFESCHLDQNKSRRFVRVYGFFFCKYTLAYFLCKSCTKSLYTSGFASFSSSIVPASGWYLSAIVVFRWRRNPSVPNWKQSTFQIYPYPDRKPAHRLMNHKKSFLSCFWIVLSSALLLSPKADFIAGSVKKPLALKAQIIRFLFRWHQFYRTDYNRRAGRYFLLSFSFLCIFPLADTM